MAGLLGKIDFKIVLLKGPTELQEPEENCNTEPFRIAAADATTSSKGSTTVPREILLRSQVCFQVPF